MSYVTTLNLSMIGKFWIPIANRCVYRKWSSSRPTYVQARRARQFVAFFSSWVLFFTGWYFYVLKMSSRKIVLVVPYFVLYWQPSAASGHHGGQQGLLCGLGGERGGCFSKKIICVSHLTLFFCRCFQLKVRLRFDLLLFSSILSWLNVLCQPRTP